MSDVIRIDAVSKVFTSGWRRRQVLAVDAVSLTVPAGEVFGFIGPNGAGKSTTIKMLTGLLQPTRGTVSLFGRAADDPEGRRGLGYVPENPSLPEHLSPLEIMRMALRLHGCRPEGEDAHCRRWLARFGLADAADKPVRGFSKGMAQRAALAQAMVIVPRLLILDEPLSGLDPIGRKEVVDILAEYRQQGGTLFLTSHVLHDVERLADRFGLIHKGRLRAVQSPALLVGGEDRVLVRSLGSAAVAGMAEEAPGRFAGEVARSELWAILEALRSAGHQLVEVKPALSLETAFLRAVGE